MAMPPPPYTREGIKRITSPRAQIRARAELLSYIARGKREKAERAEQAKQAEQAEKPANETHQSHGHSSYGRSGPTYSNSGYTPYHPYQRPRPPYMAKKYNPRSATSTQPDSTIEPSGVDEAAGLSHKVTNHALSGQISQQHVPKSLCPAFTSTGVCSRHGCRRLHDPTKQAVCKRWLYKGDCAKGDYCPLSHETSSHNAPTCLHFQDGRCKHDDCRFAHVRINPAALNCEEFGRLGYCEKGDSCSELHAHECPFFANDGACYFGDLCRLGHTHRASRMRTVTLSSSAERTASSIPAEDMETAEDVANVESMENTEDTQVLQPKAASAHSPHHFTQQADFVPLDADD